MLTVLTCKWSMIHRNKYLVNSICNALIVLNGIIKVNIIQLCWWLIVTIIYRMVYVGIAKWSKLLWILCKYIWNEDQIDEAHCKDQELLHLQGNKMSVHLWKTSFQRHSICWLCMLHSITKLYLPILCQFWTTYTHMTPFLLQDLCEF